jgi:hypothetical protein
VNKCPTGDRCCDFWKYFRQKCGFWHSKMDKNHNFGFLERGNF